MTALVAPQASEAHGPAVLRLSMGPLFEEVDPHMHAPCAWKYTVVSIFACKAYAPSILCISIEPPPAEVQCTSDCLLGSTSPLDEHSRSQALSLGPRHVI